MVLFYKIIKVQRDTQGPDTTDLWTYVVLTCLSMIFVITHQRRGQPFFGSNFVYDFIVSGTISILVADIAADLLVEFVFKSASTSGGTEETFRVYGWLFSFIMPMVVFTLCGLVVYWVEFDGQRRSLIPSMHTMVAILRGVTISQVAQIYSSVVTIAAVIMYVEGTYATGAYRGYYYYHDGNYTKLDNIVQQMADNKCTMPHARCTHNCTTSMDGWEVDFDYLDTIDAFLQPSLILDYLVRFLIATNISTHFMEMYSIADFFSISELPCFFFGMESRYLLPSFGFLKFLRLIRILNLDICKSFMSEVQLQLGVLIMTLLSMFWLCAGLLQSLEVDENPDFSCFHTAFYNAVVTLTTIGFGDMNPGSDFGKLMVCLIIIIGVGLFTKQASNVADVLAIYPKYGAKYISRSDEGHVIVGGNLTDVTVAAFLEEFFHPNHHGVYSATRVVIMSPQLPSSSLKKLMKLSQYRVTYKQGSTHKCQDLKRVGIMDADAIFVMSNKLSASPKQEDISVIMSTIAIEKTRRDIPTFVQVLNKRSIGDALTAGADVVVCVNQYRETMFASTAHCFGLSTFFGNLSRSCDYDGSAYADGCDYELYSVLAHRSLAGRTFAAVTRDVYKHCRMVVLGVYTHTTGSGMSLANRRGSAMGLSGRVNKGGKGGSGLGSPPGRKVSGGSDSTSQQDQLVRQQSGHVHRGKRAFQWSEQDADFFDTDKKGDAASFSRLRCCARLARAGLGSGGNGGGSRGDTRLKRKLLNLRSGGTLINPSPSHKIVPGDMLVLLAADHEDAENHTWKEAVVADAAASALAAAAEAAAISEQVTTSVSGAGAVSTGETAARAEVTKAKLQVKVKSLPQALCAHTKSRSGCRPILEYHEEHMDPEQRTSLKAFMAKGITHTDALVHSSGSSGAGTGAASVSGPSVSGSSVSAIGSSGSSSGMKRILVLGNWSTALIRQIVLTGWRRRQPTQVTFMDMRLPGEGAWRDLATGVVEKGPPGTFPSVRLVKGSPLNRKDLRRAGIYMASAVCIVSEFGVSEEGGQGGHSGAAPGTGPGGAKRTLDGKTIKISLVIRQIQKEVQQHHVGVGVDTVGETMPLFPVYELIDHVNVSFVDESSYIAREVALAPVYRGGHIFVPTMLDTLLCQSFFNPQITNILEVLLTSMTQIHLADDPEIRQRIEAGLTYAQLFEHLLMKRYIVVGLYSGERIDENNETTDNMSFVEKLQNVGRRWLLRKSTDGGGVDADAEEETSSSGQRSSSSGGMTASRTASGMLGSNGEAGHWQRCLFTNPDSHRKLRLQDVVLVVAPAEMFNDTWGTY